MGLREIETQTDPIVGFVLCSIFLIFGAIAHLASSAANITLREERKRERQEDRWEGEGSNQETEPQRRAGGIIETLEHKRRGK